MASPAPSDRILRSAAGQKQQQKLQMEKGHKTDTAAGTDDNHHDFSGEMDAHMKVCLPAWLEVHPYVFLLLLGTEVVCHTCL